MGDNNKSFWATLPGILTGVASVLAALTGLYVTLNPPGKQTTPTPASQVMSHVPDTNDQDSSTWPLVAEETFTKDDSGWDTSAFGVDQTWRCERRIFDGKYRWDVKFEPGGGSIPALSPYGPAVNFKAAVDVRVVDMTNPIVFQMIFGATETEQYGLQIRTNRAFALAKYFMQDGKVKVLIGDTPIKGTFDPMRWNRVTVTVTNRLIRFYLNSDLLGEIDDAGFGGGKVGLAVGGETQAAAATVDFDNFEFRRKP